MFDLKYFIKNPMQIFNIRTGGLAIYGGIIGGIITCIVFCKKRKINILDLLDYLAPALALGQAIGRWGNFANIEAYGVETTLPWRMGIYEANKYVEVHPTFLYESIATFIIFIVLMKKGKSRKFSGELTYIYCMMYGLERLIVEGLRTDSLMLGPIRISQLVSFVILIIRSKFIYKEQKKGITPFLFYQPPFNWLFNVKFITLPISICESAAISWLITIPEPSSEIFKLFSNATFCASETDMPLKFGTTTEVATFEV